ncbi:DUF3078 domain-containing protein [Carboxylicivirga taeanensis]|uniref:DUF3078 domain-containing protein n=1 Tax=Carboxylicivirga taeanensis TaxID=1416875 RepID=UPI003F6E3514
MNMIYPAIFAFYSQNSKLFYSFEMNYCIKTYLLVFCITSFIGLNTQPVNAQLGAVKWGYLVDDSEETYWQKKFYKYANKTYPVFDRLVLADLIKQRVEKEQLFTASLFPPLVNYTVETYKFDAKFRVPDFPAINFEPQYSTRSNIEKYQTFVNSKQYARKSEELFEQQYFLSEARQNYIYSHLDKIELSWDSIPNPLKIGEDGYLKRRSAREGISMLLRDHSFETHPSLEKVKFKSGPWTFQGTENILFSQGYVDNWVKGGESNISLGSDLRLTANYKKGKHDWDNYIIHKVGIISTEVEKGKVNTDLIELNTKYGHKASEKWYYSFLYNFKTQLFYGYDKNDVEKENPVSGFLAPAYMSFAIGMDYKPNSKFTLLLSPITSRLTLVADTVKFDQTKFGVPLDKSSHIVNGISVVNSLSYEVARGVKISSRLDAFYQYLGKPKKGEERQVQVDWEVIADLRINRFLSTRILGHLRYFTNESNKVQIRENFNITFSYNF